MIEFLKDAFHFIYDVEGLIRWGGTFLVCSIVFVETGLFVGFFLPGDSLLVSAGIFAAAGHLNLGWLLLRVSVCARSSAIRSGTLIGRKAGQALYRREDSLIFRKRHLERAHEFYEKYGAKTIVIARFVPIVRTFAPAVAGAANMNYRTLCYLQRPGRHPVGLEHAARRILAGFRRPGHQSKYSRGNCHRRFPFDSSCHHRGAPDPSEEKGSRRSRPRLIRNKNLAVQGINPLKI